MSMLVDRAEWLLSADRSCCTHLPSGFRSGQASVTSLLVAIYFRWGYKTLSDVRHVVQGYKEASIPLEVMWADIDYMDRYRDFTFDPQRFNQQDLKDYVDRYVFS